ncbi:hypothetical protein V502_02837 [Pseudogymnoascus sp. VKM F-4520 (FW-2644)]|nr:hypothetical protein V502_02837 [Pseudogymnoascus sp. VKM F-4520 (FW-2644)]
MELMNERLPERHDSAVMGSGILPEFWRSGTGVDVATLSESDSSGNWDYSRHNNYGDDGYDSPIDLTACDKECEERGRHREPPAGLAAVGGKRTVRAV